MWEWSAYQNKLYRRGTIEVGLVNHFIFKKADDYAVFGSIELTINIDMAI